MKDRLYLLRPDFSDGPGTKFFCAECAIVEGMLSFYPELRKRVDVQYVGFRRPRPEVVAELGLEHQGLPALVLADAAPSETAPATVTVLAANGKRFIQNEYEICNFLAAKYGLGAPHK